MSQKTSAGSTLDKDIYNMYVYTTNVLITFTLANFYDINWKQKKIK